MTATVSVTSKLGTPHLYDPVTDIYAELPAGLKIFNRKANTWIGGSADGASFLLIERLQGDVNKIPTILAEGDLDLFLCSTGRIEVLNDSRKTVSVAGTFSQVPIEGYLALGKTGYQSAYLVLLAVNTGHETTSLRGLALNILAKFFA